MFVLLFAALAIGFGLGHLQRRHKNQIPAVHKRYLEGLQHLIEEQHDAALDTLIGVLDVNETTLETHFALGALWRRKGEVERAIRIHQNLLNRSGLSPEQLLQAQLELALDYSKSGLLDRAEVLLQELLVSSAAGIRRQALQELVYLYQDEREWERAIQHAESLCQGAGPGELEFWRHLQAHYACELVESHLAADQESIVTQSALPDPINQRLTQARQFAPEHNRALLLQSHLEFRRGDTAGALETLASLRVEEPYLMVVLPLLLQVYERAGRLASLRERVTEVYNQQGFPSLIPTLAHLVCEQLGSRAAVDFAERQLRGRDPAFLADLIALLDKNTISFAQLKPILDRALPFYFHCDACGFEGKQFYWCCPTCKHWL